MNLRSLNFRPMLAASPWRAGEDLSVDQQAEALSRLVYPVLATPKIDGIRCVTRPGVSEFPDGISLPMCRSLKPVPCDHIRQALSSLPEGLDGEIVTFAQDDLFDLAKARNFHHVQSDVMSAFGNPSFLFMVFDHLEGDDRKEPYHDRVQRLETLACPDFMQKLIPVPCQNAEELVAYERACLALGHEGICFRTPDSPYKYGRSTIREQWLVKLKRHVTSEAGIIGSYELMHNNNPIAQSELGYAERTSHKDNMVGADMLGGLLCRTAEGVEFGLGTGFDRRQRIELWRDRQSLVGRTVTYRHQPHGAKEAPRTPVFVGFRDGRDL